MRGIWKKFSKKSQEFHNRFLIRDNVQRIELHRYNPKFLVVILFGSQGWTICTDNHDVYGDQGLWIGTYVRQVSGELF